MGQNISSDFNEVGIKFIFVLFGEDVSYFVNGKVKNVMYNVVVFVD